jgi:hypothetical protein
MVMSQNPCVWNVGISLHSLCVSLSLSLSVSVLDGAGVAHLVHQAVRQPAGTRRA